jgi:hypothetical protein
MLNIIPTVYLFIASESLNAITRETTSGVQDCKGVCPFLFCVTILAPSWMRKQATVAVAWANVTGTTKTFMNLYHKKEKDKLYTMTVCIILEN